jgi:hypothetical protein
MCTLKKKEKKIKDKLIKKYYYFQIKINSKNFKNIVFPIILLIFIYPAIPVISCFIITFSSVYSINLLSILSCKNIFPFEILKILLISFVAFISNSSSSVN